MKWFADLDNMTITPISDWNEGYIVASKGKCVFDTQIEAFEYIKREATASLINSLEKLKNSIDWVKK